MFYFLLLAKYCSKIIYFFLKLLPTQNKVVLISRFNNKTSIDFLLLEKEIKSINNKTKVIILNHKLKNRYYLIIDVFVEMYHLATSHSCIIDSYIIPVSILNHKKNLVIIQIWHALGAIKKFGYASIGVKEGVSKKMASIMNMHRNYNYVICSGEETIPLYKKAFNINKNLILPIGIPRVDYLINEKNKLKVKQNIFNYYPQLKNKKNILYAPTFRKKQTIPYSELIDVIDFSKYNLVIKKHHLDKSSIPNNSNIIIDEKHCILDLLFITDYLITDYSAISFEASLLEIPMYFYVYDLKQYQKNRGLFIDINKDNVPGFINEDPKKIIEAINNQIYDQKKTNKFRNNYVNQLDGNSTKKIIELLNLKK